jgi:hypothetical protein
MGGLFWLLTFVTGALSLSMSGRFVAPGDPAGTAAKILADESLFRLAGTANLVSSVCYVAATLFVYELLRPVSRRLSLLAAFFSLVGCAVGALGSGAQLAPLVVLKSADRLGAYTVEQLQALAYTLSRLNAQVSIVGFLFFGLHCFLVGSLIVRSRFLPRFVGALLAIGGLGWLILSFANLLSPSLAGSLSPWIMLPGILGEGVLTLWLLAMAVDAEAWRMQAQAAGAGAVPAAGG